MPPKNSKFGPVSVLMLSTLSLAACGKAAQGEAPPSAPVAAAPAEPVAAAAPADAPHVPAVSTVKAVNAGECPANALLDDAEDGDGRAISADKRGGYWYTYADKVGSTIAPANPFQMAAGGAEGSKFAARMTGKLGTSGILYAGMGFLFTEPKAPYDASCCKGLQFLAKKSGTGAANVRVKVGDANTTPEGGVCKDCYNDFGAELTLTDTWKKYELKFAELKQEYGWGQPHPAIDAAHLYQVQWQVRDPGADFDISVDKIELTGCGK